MSARSMRRTCSISAVFLLALSCLPCFPAPSSARTVTVFGTVRDPSERSIPLALVRFISGTDTTAALTDSAGCYSVELAMEPAVGVDDHPSGFSLGQNYPNPFNPSTVIEYTLPVPSEVRLDIYSISGQKIRTLIEGHEDAGRKVVNWDGRDQRGKGAAAGVYLYRLHAGKFVQTRKMLLLDGGSGSFIAKPAGTASRMDQTSLSFTMEVKKEGFRSWRESCRISSDTNRVEKNIFLVRHSLRVSRYPDDNYRVILGDTLSVYIFGISAPVPNIVPELLLTSATGDSEMIRLDSRYYDFDYNGRIILSANPADGPLLLAGNFPTSDAPAAPGDGILQLDSVADTIFAAYFSPADGDTVRGTRPMQPYPRETVNGTVFEFYDGGWLILNGDRWGPTVQDMFTVTFKDRVSPEAIDSLNARLGVTVVSIYRSHFEPYVEHYYLSTPKALLIDKMRAYEAEDIVQYVGPIWMGELAKPSVVK